MGLHRVLIVVLVFTLSASLVSARAKQLSDDDADVLDYIATNNPMVRTLEQTTKKTWGQYIKEGLRVGIKGSYTMSPTGDSYTVGGEGGDRGIGKGKRGGHIKGDTSACRAKVSAGEIYCGQGDP